MATASVTAAQVRKDFSIFGITGHRRGGYQVDDLLDQLNKILGKDRIQEIGLDAPRYGGDWYRLAYTAFNEF